jgi:uncharacterized protein (DUF433 family)
MIIFQWLDQISYEKKPWSSFSDDDRASFNPFMLNRFISMRSENIEVVNLIQKYPTLPKEQLYNFYCKVIPKNKTFFKYIKSKEKDFNPELIKLIANWFCVSTREAIEFYPLLNKDEVKNILSIMNISNKKIKKY